MVKELLIKPIEAKIANEFVKKNHYSGKVVPNSQIHFGVFHRNILSGVLQYGPPLRREYVLHLVKDTKWHDMIELNRMAFMDFLPKNSESRCIGITLKLLKKRYKNLEWVLSFADGTKCGDGTIYRASNFLLTGIKENDGLRVNPETGEVLQRIAAYHRKLTKEFERDFVPLEGHQFRYIYFYDKKDVARLTVPIIPFSKIKEIGASMYKGQKNAI